MSVAKPKVDFEQVVRDAGIPTTADEMQAQWNKINEEQGSLISNDSNWSAFWQLISSIVTAPALWLVNFMITYVLPNSFIAYATGVALDVQAWSVDLERKSPLACRGYITFYRSASNNAVNIAAGTLIKTPAINGTVYAVFVINDTLMNVGDTELNILCEASETGSAFNLAPGYYSILVEPIDTITSVRNNDGWIVEPGSDAESDEDLQLRCQNQFSAVGFFHTDSAYIAIISQFAGISTQYIYFKHGAPRGPGTANAYIMIDSGVPSQLFIDSINTHINDNGYHGLGDDMLCFPMPFDEHDLAPTVWIDPTFTTDQTNQYITGITDMIRCAFRENTDYDDAVSKTFPNARFSFSVLGEELHNQFTGLLSIEFGTEDIDNTGTISLPVLNSLTITKGTES